MAALKRMLRLALQNETLSRMPHVPVPKPRNTEAHLAERVALNVSEAEQEADPSLPTYVRHGARKELE